MDENEEKKEWVHAHDIVTAFAVGVLTADPWTKRYSVPPGFADVLNHIAARTQEHLKDEVVQLSPQEVRSLWEKWAPEHPQFLKWNEWEGHAPDAIQFTDRYSATPEARDFIDLTAVFQNAEHYLRKVST